jgi:hypothetical protein
MGVTSACRDYIPEGEKKFTPSKRIIADMLAREQ